MSKAAGPERSELQDLRMQVADLTAVLEAIRSGGVDALVVGAPGEERLYPLVSADRPYRVIVEQMGTAAATISARGVLLYANQGLADLLGQARSDVLGRHISDLLSAPPEVFSGMESVGPGHTVRGEAELLRGDGTRVPVLASMTGMDLDGSLVRCLVAVDLTERRAAEASLAASERRYRMLAENSTDVIVQVTLDGTIVWVSESAGPILGWQREAVVGTATTEHIHHDDLPGLRASLETTLASGGPSDATFRLRRSDGTYLWMHAAGKEAPGGDGPPRSRVVRLRDVTAAHEANLALSLREAQARATLDALLDPLVLLTSVKDERGAVVDFVYTQANASALAYMRASQEELLGSRMLERYPGLAAGGWFDRYAACATTGEPLRVEGEPMTSAIYGPDRRFDVSATAWADGIVLTWRDVTQRVADRAELRLLAENASDLVGRADNDGILTWFSESIRAYGWDPKELVGRHAAEFLHPEDRHLLAEVAETTSRGETARVQWRIAEKDHPDSWHWFRVHIHPVADETGQTIGRISGWQNIDAEITATSALAASEARYRLLAERGTDVVLGGSPDRVLEWVSPSVSRVLGWDPADMLGLTVGQFLHPDDVPIVEAATRAADSGQLMTYRARLRHRDGRWRWMEVRAERVLDGQGSLTGWIGSARDVSDQVESELALEASEELFRTALESASVGVCLLAPTGRVLRVNPALCALLGRDERTLLAGSWRDWQELANAEEVTSELSLLAELGAGKRDSYRLHKRFVRRDGSVVHGDVSVGCVRDPSGAVRHLVAQIVDVTAEHTLAEDLAADRARLRATLDSELDPHMTLTAVRDKAGRVVDFTYSDANPAALSYLRLTADQVIGARMTDLYRGPAVVGLRALLAEALETRTPISVDGYAYPNLFGEGDGDRIFDIRGALIGDAVSLTWRDVTDREAAAAALAASEQRYRLLADHAGDIVVELDISGALTYVSPSVASVSGWAPEDLLGSPLAHWVHPEDQATVAAAVATGRAAIDGAATTRARMCRRDGTYLWIAGVVREVRDAHGTPLAAVAILRDIQAEVEAQQVLAQQATTDALTGLLNRREMIARLDATLAHPPRQGSELAVLYLDLDRLKRINDERGHNTGDLLLLTTANRLAAAVRDDDQVARVGGDELLILLVGVRSLADATAVAENYRRIVAEPIPSPDGPPIISTASIGVTLARPHEATGTLIERADRAMYAAKQQGGNRVVATD